uniref:ATPase AAA-type core domain-containing protein n=1 Tax=Candidatus Kentrum sp. LPFa TaxID=2126335 RepID=A0A450X453_9GAMM|nr:MAG: hypothetical protein BECKLPF1236A_GA0070988_1001516 [Candidatus Kentron sp. LPFa]VFK24104.1 MAG: hypothetical protein BECKLPF1236C_GA0070990_1001018 [Candidatus Kentron sp. LPFa]
MLIELAVSNYRSIRDEQRLSLVAGREKIHRDANTFEPAQPKGRKRLCLLRSVALYGPNASGKTNLVRALATMRRVVLESQQRMGSLPMEYFLFDHSKPYFQQPTLLEVIIMVEGVRYQYGFSATAERIHDEWLFAFPKGREQRWFEREFFPIDARDEFTFGNNLAGDKEVWRRATRPDALFLSTAVQLNSQQLLPLFNWFKDTLCVVGIGGLPPYHSLEWCRNDGERKQRILKFLRVADFNINDVVVEGTPIDPELSLNDLPISIRPIVLDRISKARKEDYTVYFMRRITPEPQLKPNIEIDRERQPRPYATLSYTAYARLDIKQESDGTQKMFNLAAPWLDALDQGRVLVVDELHDNLHPLLVQFLVRLFHSPDTNPKGAQLLFTTHETSILSDEYLRRDQIWFFERDKEQASRLYPLTNFKPPKGIANLEQDYLVGGYGAVPFLRNPSRIFED